MSVLGIVLVASIAVAGVVATIASGAYGFYKLFNKKAREKRKEAENKKVEELSEELGVKKGQTQGQGGVIKIDTAEIKRIWQKQINEEDEQKKEERVTLKIEEMELF